MIDGAVCISTRGVEARQIFIFHHTHLKAAQMRAQPFTHKKTLTVFIIIASTIAIAMDYAFGTRLDYWLHDSAVNYQARTEWKHAGMVVLDNKVPIRVGRKQTLPLYARASEFLVAQGVKGIFLDAQVSKEIEGRMPYAVCIEADGQARWSEPGCDFDHNQQCTLRNSEAGDAPLKMNEATIARFSIAPYNNDEAQLPEFLLYGIDAMMVIPETGLVASDRLVTKSSPVSRWLDMSVDHAIHRLASQVAPDKISKLYVENKRLDEICYDNIRCRRVRLSRPLHKISWDEKRLILPLSELASCDDEKAKKAAALLKDKVVILQTTSPTEHSDIIITPMISAALGPKLLTPGAQYLVDELETVLAEDYPRQPHYPLKISLFILAAVLSVLLGAYFSQPLLWCSGIAVFLLTGAACFFYPVTQLWPVTAIMAAYLAGAVQIVAAHLLLGFRQGSLLYEYLPKQVIDILVPLTNDDDFFKNRPCNVVVLMSDLAGYTTVTGLLKEPEYVMNLMNDYLGATSIVLQDKYNGILEAYVGDLVCYYWDYEKGDEKTAYRNALAGAVELASLQKKFFSSVSLRYKEDLPPEVIEKLTSIIDAGIGLAAGHAAQGNLGPKEGVKKFSLLGDPLNLASRVEGLTRHFNTEIIVAGDFSLILEEEGLAVRRIGRIGVKGRIDPETVYALGKKDDPRFSAENIAAWEAWVEAIESDEKEPVCPEIYAQDKETILGWKARNLLSENGSWKLHEK